MLVRDCIRCVCVQTNEQYFQIDIPLEERFMSLENALVPRIEHRLHHTSIFEQPYRVKRTLIPAAYTYNGIDAYHLPLSSSLGVPCHRMGRRGNAMVGRWIQWIRPSWSRRGWEEPSCRVTLRWILGVRRKLWSRSWTETERKREGGNEERMRRQPL